MDVGLEESGAAEAFDEALREAEFAAAEIAYRTGVPRHEVAVIAGSGWGQAVGSLGEGNPETVREVSYAELPGFAAPVVGGHAGRLRSMQVRGLDGRMRSCLLFLGRTHLYEGRGVHAAVHAARTAAAAGARVLIVTNGCGGIRDDLAPGTVALLSDHVNLTGTSPLVGPRFVDLSEAYSRRLREVALGVDSSLAEGVYAQLGGPAYETPAEVRMLATMGIDLVGMSTALETVAARAAGVEVLGISLVTNRAAGTGGAEALSHAEVMQAGAAHAGRIAALLACLLPAV